VGSIRRCALKIYIKKDFDTISWEYILLGLRAIGVPSSMIKWIEVYISIMYFSVAMNKELHGFFLSYQGIW
jgi:hypothetical protein